VPPHLVDERVSELCHLLLGGWPRRALDPGKRVADVLFRKPGHVALDLHADIALLEQDWCAVAAQYGVAKPRLQPIPAGGQRAGQITDVLVVHAQKRAEIVLFHHFTRTLGSIAAQAISIDALLPVHADRAETCDAHSLFPGLFGSAAPLKAADAFNDMTRP
jgi:hypothetical protein